MVLVLDRKVDVPSRQAGFRRGEIKKKKNRTDHVQDIKHFVAAHRNETAVHIDSRGTMQRKKV